MINKNKFNIRIFTQIIFFVFILLISINKYLGITLIPEGSLHSLCPYGGIETFISFITAGTIVRKIHESALILAALILMLTLLFGPVFCSFVCPLGSIQEWFGKIGKLVFKKKYNHFIPYKFDKYLRFLRYITLIWTVYLTTQTMRLVFLEVDPYFALFNLWSDEVTIGGIIVLVSTLILSLFVERPWCKYACPYGAFLGIFNKIRLFKIRRNSSSCINCKICDNTCPMNITVSEKDKITNHQCISCFECTSEYKCPIAKTVTFSTKKEGVK
ncbi:4Fe-4S binding protein [Vallitalea maricola]|uniref:Uncharacterized protein n=1 Tax=Vallitalea maricola TaxID=3074433 RepID=A0ACB5UMI2_9FIRM|nr:hypothetical protein AN2V17_29780 [Vallitalea sp. AN17-2]